MRGKNIERQKAREAGELARRKKQLLAGSLSGQPGQISGDTD